ncbi:right-handed parallel beta-helix repeat-containing protein [Actinopolymorpha rutila]|uniref:Right handed beta helix domain-containing protein n=1 Tax=Actinopolymorpha rutila TaxID=446787 RepID=A0A852ZJX6_9ACTN|nr:hypothetical protein [Actinopolymorpha rutila]
MTVSTRADKFTGQWELEVLSTDNPELDPTGWAYTVHVIGDGVDDTIASVSAPMGAPVDPATGKPTIDLVDLTSGSVAGDRVGRDWTLDSTQIAGKPATFPPQTHSHATGEVTGLAAVATTGSYDDLLDAPPSDTGGSVQVDSLVWNVKDHGVVGDGTADDTAALQAMFTAAPANTWILFPHGTTCKISGTLTLSKPFHIEGGEIVQVATNAYGFSLTSGASGTVIREVRFTGPGATNYGGNRRAIHLQGNSATSRVGDVLVEGCTISGWSFGVSCRLGERITVRGCKILTMGYAGVHFFSVNRCKVTDNYIDDVRLTGSNVDCYGITINRIENVTIAAEPLSEGGLVSRNQVLNVAWEGIDSHGGINLVIADNYVYGCLNGIALVAGGNENNVETYACKAMVVRGNVVVSGVTNGTKEVGIKVVGAGTAVGALVDGATGIISGNYVHGHGKIGSTNAAGIMVYYTSGMVITDNIVVEPSSFGINAYHTNRGVVIANNLVIDPWDASVNSTLPTGVFLRDRANINALVHGNVVQLGSKVAPSKLFRGVSINNTATGILGINYAPEATNKDVLAAPGMIHQNNSFTFKFHDSAGSSRTLGFFGNTPVSQQVIGASPTADVTALKRAVDAIQTALVKSGLARR